MKWLFLVHQVHTPNSRERVKVWRAIRKTGALLYRNSVYVLPYSKERLEDFQWVCQEIADSLGEASVFIAGAQSRGEDHTIQNLFRAMRKQEYADWMWNAEKLLKGMKQEAETKSAPSLYDETKQLREKLEEIRKIDFFPDSTQKKAFQMMEKISARMTRTAEPPVSEKIQKRSAKEFQKKTWTTREGIHIDRLCSAWLIRRFIDPSAKFVFAAESSLPENAIPFDVFGAEFSHHGDRCTFETLIEAFGLRDSALNEIAQIIHDVDLKDHKFGRAEGSGVDLVIRSLGDFVGDDHKLLEMGSSLLDSLYQRFSKRSKRFKG
jgi:hypothetical protein